MAAGFQSAEVAVIGGGIAGLVAARDLAHRGFSVVVLESSDAVGGQVAPRTIAGITVDSGAESFAVRGGTVAGIAGELGLDADIVTPNPAGAWLQLPDRAVRMPRGGVLGIPSTPLAADVVAAIGWGGAIRAYMDRIMPLLAIGKQRNLATLVRRRMGKAVLERLVTPISAGVYSSDPDGLDVEVLAPGLNSAMSRAGSLSGGAAELLFGAPSGSPVGGISGGMSRLVPALVADIEKFGGVIRTGVHPTTLGTVTAVDLVAVSEGAAPDATAASAAASTTAAANFADGVTTTPLPPRWRMDVSDGEVLVVGAVVIATPADSALPLIAALAPTAAKLASDQTPETPPGAVDVAGTGSGTDTTIDISGWPAATAVDLATLVLDDARLDSAPRGTGALVAAGVPGVIAKALTHATAKWSWLAEAAGEHRHVLRLSYGRAGKAGAPGENPAHELSDAELMRLAISDASKILGIELDPATIVGWARTRWDHAVPLGVIGQRERVSRVRSVIDLLPGIEATGGWLSGTGLAQVIPDARAAAARIRRIDLLPGS